MRELSTHEAQSISGSYSPAREAELLAHAHHAAALITAIGTAVGFGMSIIDNQVSKAQMIFTGFFVGAIMGMIAVEEFKSEYLT